MNFLIGVPNTAYTCFAVGWLGEAKVAVSGVGSGWGMHTPPGHPLNIQ